MYVFFFIATLMVLYVPTTCNANMIILPSRFYPVSTTEGNSDITLTNPPTILGNQCQQFRIYGTRVSACNSLSPSFAWFVMFSINNVNPTAKYTKLTTDPDILQRAKNEFSTTAELVYIVTITFRHTGGYYTQFVFASDNNANHFASLIYGDIQQTSTSYSIYISKEVGTDEDSGEPTYDKIWRPSISETANSYNISTMSNVGVPGVYRFALNATSLIHVDPPPPVECSAMDCKSRMKALACAYLRRENLMNIPKVCN